MPSVTLVHAASQVLIIVSGIENGYTHRLFTTLDNDIKYFVCKDKMSVALSVLN